MSFRQRLEHKFGEIEKARVDVSRKGYNPGSPLHPQVDSGMGFTCDSGIVELVRAIYCTPFDLSTDASCQEWVLHRTGAKWKKPQGYISIRGRSFDDLIEFGVTLQGRGLDNTKFGYEIPIDVWAGILGPRAYLHFDTDYAQVLGQRVKDAPD